MNDWNNLAEITLASLSVSAESRALKNAPAIASEKPVVQHHRPEKLPSNIEDPRIVEALIQLQRRRQVALGSGGVGPKILNSHPRSRIDLPPQRAKIHPPRKPHG